MWYTTVDRRDSTKVGDMTRVSKTARKVVNVGKRFRRRTHFESASLALASIVHPVEFARRRRAGKRARKFNRRTRKANR